MKTAQIIHNPTAGEGIHDAQELKDLVKDAGYKMNYISTEDEGWENFILNKPEVIFVAGGDGTVNKVSAVLLQQDLKENSIPINLVPLGTANNIATTLEIPKQRWEEVIGSDFKITYFDIGKIEGLAENKFFLESVGFGIFPELISRMKDNPVENESTSDKLRRTLKVLLKIVEDYKPEKAKIDIDGIKIKGSFLMVELMNIKYIGPNLKLAPNVHPGDEYFNLIMIPEKNRKQMVEYVRAIIEKKTEVIDLHLFVKTMLVKKVKMKWKGKKIHVDDDLIEDYSGESLKIDISPGALKFFNTKIRS